jgi:hypothetical protein
MPESIILEFNQGRPRLPETDAQSRPQETDSMQISWKLTRDAIPDALWLPQDLTALDGDRIIGRVYRIEHGAREGWWHWTLTDPPGSPASGVERERGKAGRRLLESYWKLGRPATLGAA